MSKKTCFMIFVITVIAIMAAFILKFSAVTNSVNATFAAMKNPYIAGSAVVLAFLFKKTKHYWLVMAGCSVVVAILVQLFVMKDALNAWSLVYQAAAFLVYVYLTVLIRFML